MVPNQKVENWDENYGEKTHRGCSNKEVDGSLGLLIWDCIKSISNIPQGQYISFSSSLATSHY